MDHTARTALRAWRASPDDSALAMALVRAWERSGGFGDVDVPPPAPQEVVNLGPNRNELVLQHGSVLQSYSARVAVRIQGAPGVAFCRAEGWSRTTARHVREWAGGADMREVDASEFSGLLARAQVGMGGA